MSYDVFGVGNAIMDMQVRCDDAFLENLRIEKGIMTLLSDSIRCLIWTCILQRIHVI